MNGKLHYLEIVTHDVDSLCTFYTRTAELQFNGPDGDLGGTRVAELPGGSLLGVCRRIHGHASRTGRGRRRTNGPPDAG